MLLPWVTILWGPSEWGMSLLQFVWHHTSAHYITQYQQFVILLYLWYTIYTGKYRVVKKIHLGRKKNYNFNVEIDFKTFVI